jgi:hypothetical protein
MRIAPSLSSANGTNYFYCYNNGSQDYVNSFSLLEAGESTAIIRNTTEAAGTAGHGASTSTNNASSYLAFSSEL